MNSETFYFPTDPVIPAAVTICVNVNYSGSAMHEFFERSLSFESLFEVIQIDPIMLVTQGVRLKRSDDKLEFVRKCVTVYKIATSCCYHIDYMCYFEKRPTIKYSNVKQSLVPLIFVAQLDNVLMDKVMFLSSSISPPATLSTGMFNLRPNHTLLVTYRRQELNLMKWPFVTKCRDYDKSDFYSQEWCYNNCIGRRLFHLKLGIPSALPYRKTWPLNATIVARLEPKIIEDHVRTCSNQCSHLSCQLIEYVGQTVAETPFANATAIYLQLTTSADLKVTYSPKMPITEFITLLGSVPGLWLGFSAMTLVEGVQWLFKKFNQT